MPYLEEALRRALKNTPLPGDPGEINYLVTKIIVDYLTLKGLRYIRVNDVVGALECCKLEFYRRVAAPYEDKKIESNGDVYPKDLAF